MMKALKTLLNVGFVIIFTFNVYDFKVRDHCHITGKYRDSAHRDCNIKFKLNHKIFIEFHNLNNHDSYRVMQELILK